MAENNEIQVASEDNNMAFSIPDGYICTLDASTQGGKLAIAKALNGSSPLKNEMDKPLELAGVITTPGTRAVSNTPCTNNYMALADGTVLFSQSDGVTRSLKVIVALWGEGMRNGEPVKVKCIAQTLNNGNTLKTIVPA